MSAFNARTLEHKGVFRTHIVSLLVSCASLQIPFSVEKEQLSSLLAVTLQVLTVTAKVHVGNLAREKNVDVAARSTC